MTSSKLYAEAAGTHRYYLHVDYETGTSASNQLAYSYIRAKYYPTLYGTVTLSNVTSSANLTNTSTDGSQPAPPAEITTITVQEHNARLEAEVAKVKAELEARLQKIEQQLNQNKQTRVEE
jgi:outer membrane protein OmpA-like peptidoglycan-associated protein